jgi:hypothetical protein
MIGCVIALANTKLENFGLSKCKSSPDAVLVHGGGVHFCKSLIVERDIK